MKLFLVLIVSMMGSTATATCINLSGSYEDKDAGITLKIDQSQCDSVTLSFNSGMNYHWRADGVLRKLADSNPQFPTFEQSFFKMNEFVLVYFLTAVNKVASSIDVESRRDRFYFRSPDELVRSIEHFDVTGKKIEFYGGERVYRRTLRD